MANRSRAQIPSATRARGADDEIEMSRTFGTRLPGLIGFAGILATFLFVITPLTIYLGNIDEFVLAFETLGAHCLKPAVVLVGTLVAIGCLLPESIFDRYVGSIAALCILVWIQGHLFGITASWMAAVSTG